MPTASARRVRYTIDLTHLAWLALVRHGYDPVLPPRGLSGPPGRLDGMLIGRNDEAWVHLPLRNRVCELDGILIDDHESSDLDPGGPCIHCGKDPEGWADDE